MRSDIIHIIKSNETLFETDKEYIIDILNAWKSLEDAYNHEECDLIPEYIRDKFFKKLKHLEEKYGKV